MKDRWQCALLWRYRSYQESNKVISGNAWITHRKTTNEELAQLIYASFLQRPFTAKDKKSALFNNDYTQTDYVINKIYHEIYNWDPVDDTNNGVVFKLSKDQIDEALFVQQLYKETKKLSRSRLRDRLTKAQEAKERATTPEQIKDCDNRIAGITMSLDTVGICMFYFITLYYEFKSQFEDADLKKKGYNYDKYYSDKKYRNDLIDAATNLFLHYTVQTLTKTAIDNNKSANVNNWVRSAGCEKAFLDALRNEINSNFQIEDSFKEFCDKYRV